MRSSLLCQLGIAIGLLAIGYAFCSPQCQFNIYPASAISSSYSAALLGASSLQDCLDFLIEHASSHAAVSYNAQTQECCVVSNEFEYTLTYDADWETYEIRSGSVSHGTTTKKPVPTTEGQQGGGGDDEETTTKAQLTTQHTSAPVPVQQINYKSYCLQLDDYVSVGSVSVAHYYKCNDNSPNLNWQTAKEVCESTGWQLAQLQVDTVYDAVASKEWAKAYLPDDVYGWVGAHYEESTDTYKWTASGLIVNETWWPGVEPLPHYDYFAVSLHEDLESAHLHTAEDAMELYDTFCSSE